MPSCVFERRKLRFHLSKTHAIVCLRKVKTELSPVCVGVGRASEGLGEGAASQTLTMRPFLLHKELLLNA